MKRLPDITGRKIGRLTVISQAARDFRGKKQSVCECVCDCGNKVSVPASKLITSNGAAPKTPYLSCGCLRSHGDLVGRTFGRLTVIAQDGSSAKGGTLWKCKCDCGTEKTVSAYQLINGTVRSCGCLLREHQAAIREHSESGAVAAHTASAEKKRYITRYGDREKRIREGERLADALSDSVVLADGTNVPALTNTHPQGHNPYRGVCWNNKKGSWMAYCCVGGRRWQKYGFRSPEDAKEARDNMQQKMIEASGLQDAIDARAEYLEKTERRIKR